MGERRVRDGGVENKRWGSGEREMGDWRTRDGNGERETGE